MKNVYIRIFASAAVFAKKIKKKDDSLEIAYFWISLLMAANIAILIFLINIFVNKIIIYNKFILMSVLLTPLLYNFIQLRKNSKTIKNTCKYVSSKLFILYMVLSIIIFILIGSIYIYIL